MEITDIRVRQLSASGKVRAFASVTFDHMFVVHELRVIEGSQGLFVSMPSRKTSGGEYRDLAHPITAECRQVLQDAVLGAYRDKEAKVEEPAEVMEAMEEMTEVGA